MSNIGDIILISRGANDMHGVEGKIIASDIQGGSDACINLYLVEMPDGHLEVAAQDNAINWLVGDADDEDNNAAQVETIGADRLDDFAETVVKHHDEGLRDFLVERIAAANAHKGDD